MLSQEKKSVAGWCDEVDLLVPPWKLEVDYFPTNACPECFIPPITQQFAKKYNFYLLNRIY